MANFNAAAVNALFDSVLSAAMALGDFEAVNGFEPKSAPSNGLTAALWVQDIRPIKTSGLSSTSGLVVFNMRVYTTFLGTPPDMVDPNMLAAVSDVIGAYSGSFTFGETVREVDLLGAYGPGLSGVAGYLNQDGKIFRVMTITIPVVVNDLWTQEA